MNARLSGESRSLSPRDVRDLFTYEPATGQLRWKVSPARRINAGDIAGGNGGHGYLRVKVRGRSLSAHRVVWAHQYGEWPTNQLDHINGIRSDNRLENLRECTNAENQQNRGVSRANKSGFPGVHWVQHHKKWRSYVVVNRKKHYVGMFDAPEAAHAAYCEAKKRLHSFNPFVRVR